MARRTTLNARSAQLTELKDALTAFTNREAVLETLQHQVGEAERLGFPPTAVEAIRGEVRALEKLALDIPEVERRIDILRRWVTVEREYQNVFGPTTPTPTSKPTTSRKKRGRPPKQN